MSRGLPTNTAAQLASSLARPIHFVKCVFSDGTLNLHDQIGQYVWGGSTWLGTGDLGQISQAQEGEDLSPYAVTLTLSGIDNTISQAALNQKYYGQEVVIYLGVLSELDVLVDTPVQIWKGKGSQMETTHGDSATGDSITYRCESDMELLTRAANLRYTAQSLQAEYSGDKFLNFLPDIRNKRVRWRRHIGGFDTPGTQEPPDNVLPGAPMDGDTPY